MALEIEFIGEVQKVADGRDTNNSWVDVTIRMPVSKHRLDTTNEFEIRKAYRNRNVVSGNMMAVDEPLFEKDSDPVDPNRGELIEDEDD